MSDSKQDTINHIIKVQDRIKEFCDDLHRRSIAHDASKLMEPEKSGYDRITAKLSDLKYPSEEYKAALESESLIIQHHYFVNDHHPEHYENGINDMSLMAIVEMLCDWKAASERTKQGSISNSLRYNKDRFGIDDQLYKILVNTIEKLGW